MSKKSKSREKTAEAILPSSLSSGIAASTQNQYDNVQKKVRL